MNIEIERKFLVDKQLWAKEIPERSYIIKQGYIVSDIDKTIRVRIKNNKGYLTIKGKAENLSRPEFEYEIPLIDANQLLERFTTEGIDKIRHIILYKGKTWEVDEFKGANEGLLLAEIELIDAGEHFERPVWLLEEVTEDFRYSNSNLVKMPFKEWNRK